MRRAVSRHFTNRAAGELRERTIRLVGAPGRAVQAGPLHSICARVPRRDGEAIGLDRRFVIYDAEDQGQLMKRVLREEGLEAKGETRPAAILGAISRAKNEMLDPGESSHSAWHGARPGRGSPGVEAALNNTTRSTRRPAPERYGCSTHHPRRSRTTTVAYLKSTNTRTRTPQYLWIRALASNTQPRGRRRRRPAISGWLGADIRNIRLGATEPTRTSSSRANTDSTQLILDAAHSVVSKDAPGHQTMAEERQGAAIGAVEEYNEEEEGCSLSRRVED